MQARKPPTARWQRLLTDADVKNAIATELNGVDWRYEQKKHQESPMRDKARLSEQKAAAEAALSPKATLVPKKANWRKKGFSGAAEAPTQAHEMWSNLLSQQLGQHVSTAAASEVNDASSPPLSPARGLYGSQRPMSTKGREYQLERQLEAQQRRRMQEMRARYKERFDTANLRHKEWEIACTFACLATAAAQHHAWHCPAHANRSSDMMRCPYRHLYGRLPAHHSKHRSRPSASEREDGKGEGKGRSKQAAIY